MSFTIGDKFIKKIRDRLLVQNKNWLAVVCGETGSGKSYSAIGLGLMIGRIHIVFSAVELLQLVNNPEVLKRGDVIIFEEGGILLSSRNWYSTENKVLGAVFQSFRNLNVAVIFTTPHLKFIDVQARVLFHNYFQTYKLNPESKTAFLKGYEIVPDSRTDKIFYKKPTFVDFDGKVVKLKFICVKMPPQEILEVYEKRKTEFTQKVNREALESVQAEINPVVTQDKTFNPSSYMEQIYNNRDRFIKLKNGSPFVDQYALMNEFNLGQSTARRLKLHIETKERDSNIII